MEVLGYIIVAYAKAGDGRIHRGRGAGAKAAEARSVDAGRADRAGKTETRGGGSRARSAGLDRDRRLGMGVEHAEGERGADRSEDERDAGDRDGEAAVL